MSVAYSNVPFALADDSNFFGSLWETVEGIGNKVIGQAGEQAEKTGQGVIDQWLNAGSQYVGGVLSPDGSVPPMSPANPNLGPLPQTQEIKTTCPPGTLWAGDKCIPLNRDSDVSTGGAMDFVKNPLVLGGAGLGIAKLAGLSWGYSIGIGAASYFLAPMLLEKI